jgi:diamine N-acetyltransferase
MAADMLTGKNIRLRALEPGDVDTLYNWENDTSIWRVSNTITPFSKFQIEAFVLNSQHDLFSSGQLRLMAELMNSGDVPTPVGTIDLFEFDPVNLRAGVGILIREPFREKGFGYEVMEILIGYAFGTLRLHQLFCNISPDNAASIHLFEKLGFTRCGVKKDWIKEGKMWKSEWMFQLISRNE